MIFKKKILINGKILHTLYKYALNSSAIKLEIFDNDQIEIFFTQSIIQCYYHFNLFAKQFEHKGAKFRKENLIFYLIKNYFFQLVILPNESHHIFFYPITP